jgi:DnaJ-class molecular chaperone
MKEPKLLMETKVEKIITILIEIGTKTGQKITIDGNGMEIKSEIQAIDNFAEISLDQKEQETNKSVNEFK